MIPLGGRGKTPATGPKNDHRNPTSCVSCFSGGYRQACAFGKNLLQKISGKAPDAPPPPDRKGRTEINKNHNLKTQQVCCESRNDENTDAEEVEQKRGITKDRPDEEKKPEGSRVKSVEATKVT